MWRRRQMEMRASRPTSATVPPVVAHLAVSPICEEAVPYHASAPGQARPGAPTIALPEQIAQPGTEVVLQQHARPRRFRLDQRRALDLLRWCGVRGTLSPCKRSGSITARVAHVRFGPRPDREADSGRKGIRAGQARRRGRQPPVYRKGLTGRTSLQLCKLRAAVV